MNRSAFTWLGHDPDDPAHDRIIAFLTMDIQKSPIWIAELLQHLQDVKSGTLPSWERPGNAYCLYIYPDHVEIEDDYSDEAELKTRISFETFSAAAHAWQQILVTDAENQ